MQKYSSIYDFNTIQENSMFRPIYIIGPSTGNVGSSDYGGYTWLWKNHVRTTVLYKNSQLESGKLQGTLNEKPVKNIIRPILNLQYRTEGFDVKDIELFVDNAENYYKSFLVKKFHDKWARENGMDTFIDEMVESYVDFGGALVKKVNGARPEVVPIQSIAWCDQTDLLSGPFAIKHYYSPSELKEMEKVGWGNPANGATMSIDDLIKLSENKKTPEKVFGLQNITPGAYIELYEIHGSLPDYFMADEPNDIEEYSLQVHIIGFYYDSSNEKQGVTLFSKKESELPFKLILRDKIYGRALGMGGAEELFEAQVWVNYGEIRIKEMLDAASKTIFKTTDANLANRNNMENVDNGAFLELGLGTDVTQLDTAPRNVPAFDRYIQDWEAHAQMMGAANDSIQGKSPSSGTPFRLQELVVAQSQGLHDYRKGKLATFLDEIYREWIMPYVVKEISKGTEFLAELDLDELQEIADKLVQNQANNLIKEKILNGELVDSMAIDQFKTKIRNEFMRGGNKRFLKILQGEFKNIPMSIQINITGKQTYLAEKVDKLVNVFRQIIAAPQILTNPGLAKLFNQILESSGLSPVDFSGLTKETPLPTSPASAIPTKSPILPAIT